IWVPTNADDTRSPDQIPDEERDYYLERRYPAFGNLVPRDVAARNAKRVVDEGRGVGPQKNGVYLDFAGAIQRLGRRTIEERYGNLFEMYQKITGEDPYEVPMRIYPAPHYTMGGLWVDYNLMSNLPGLYVLGEANFSDHGANRLGASALMQGLADGYFVLPYTIGDDLAGRLGEPLSTESAPFAAAEAEARGRIERLLAAKGSRSVDSFHRELGRIVWDRCGISRTAAGLAAGREEIAALRERYWREVRIQGSGEELNQELERAGRVADYFELAELMCLDALERDESCGGHFREEHQTPEGEALRERYWREVRIQGSGEELNQELERAGRVADYFELAELMCLDALERDESCGGHFREEHLTPEGEALRDDDRFAYVAAWEWQGEGRRPALHKEPLAFEFVEPSRRSYK
ncbi:MAG TPA: FAD-binding protein, partial [Thermoanaerobaculia bacterium]|nr:FAD-binding protein [Thermoanaerobaculia bacterium]